MKPTKKHSTKRQKAVADEMMLAAVAGDAINEHRSRDYASLSPSQRADSALEMATEILEENERVYALAAAIIDQLKPDTDDANISPIALSLAEILEDRLSRCGQKFRLVQCLKTMQIPETGVSHG